MDFIINHKYAICFYLVLLLVTFLLSLRVENLESKEDYYKYSQNIVMNNLK